MEIENVRVMKSRLNVRMLESISLFSSSGKYPFEEFLGQRKPFDAAKNRLISCGGAKVYLNGTLGRVDFEFANDCAAWRAGAGGDVELALDGLAVYHDVELARARWQFIRFEEMEAQAIGALFLQLQLHGLDAAEAGGGDPF